MAERRVLPLANGGMIVGIIHSQSFYLRCILFSFHSWGLLIPTSGTYLPGYTYSWLEDSMAVYAEGALGHRLVPLEDRDNIQMFCLLGGSMLANVGNFSYYLGALSQYLFVVFVRLTLLWYPNLIFLIFHACRQSTMMHQLINYYDICTRVNNNTHSPPVDSLDHSTCSLLTWEIIYPAGYSLDIFEITCYYFYFHMYLWSCTLHWNQYSKCWLTLQLRRLEDLYMAFCNFLRLQIHWWEWSKQHPMFR